MPFKTNVIFLILSFGLKAIDFLFVLYFYNFIFIHTIYI